MNIQDQISKTVTGGRGFNNGSYSFNPENTSDAALQAKLALMEDYLLQSMNLRELDRDLKMIGLSDVVNTPERVEMASRMKAYILRLALAQAESALSRKEEQPSIGNTIPNEYILQRFEKYFIENKVPIEYKNFPEFIRPFPTEKNENPIYHSRVSRY